MSVLLLSLALALHIIVQLTAGSKLADAAWTVALLIPAVFHDELRIGASISITVVLAVVIGLGAGLATLAPYRRDYRAAHA